MAEFLIFLGVAYLVLWLPSQIVGRAAQARGRSYWLWFLLALPCNAILTWIVVMLLPDRSRRFDHGNGRRNGQGR